MGKIACCFALVVAGAVALPAQPVRNSTGLAMQAARAEGLALKGKKAFYPADRWDLGDLPAYVPREKISGPIRLWGSNYIVDGNLGEYWEQAFRKFHPDTAIEFHMLTTRAAVPSLVFGVADLGIGRKIKTEELQLYQRYKNRDPLEIVLATGSYNVTGWNPGFGIVVHQDNPLARITLGQLDGIFGAERLGGWVGTDWHPELARGPEKNIRTWGQLGLTGEWADKPIHLYGPPGLAPGGVSFFQSRVMGGADTWAEGLKEFADRKAMTEALSKDPYGIAYTGLCYQTPQTKVLALAEDASSPAIAPTRENVASRAYPLARPVYIYFAPDTPGGDPARPDPTLREFLRYILSRQGQQDVTDEGDFLPLPAAAVSAQLKKLEQPPARP